MWAGVCFAKCVCVSALSGGALNKVELHDLLILEQSSFKNKAFSKVSKVTRPSCNSSSRFPISDSGVRADAAVESFIFLSSE